LDGISLEETKHYCVVCWSLEPIACSATAKEVNDLFDALNKADRI
jgi:hypothetical protein